MRSYHRLLCSTSCGSCLPREYQPNITPSVRAVHLHPNIVILFALEVSVFHGPRVSCYWSWERTKSQKKQSRCIILVRLTTSEILFGMYIIHCSLQFDLGDDLNWFHHGWLIHHVILGMRFHLVKNTLERKFSCNSIVVGVGWCLFVGFDIMLCA